MEERKAAPDIQTVSGRRVNPFAPDPSEIVIEDIAHALANQCRFGGHSRTFYSVAQHSCLLADLLSDEGGTASDELWALLHDAAEAYLVDLPHPVKYRTSLGERFRTVEARLHSTIIERFGLPPDPPPRLRELDRALLAAEKDALVSPTWDWPELEGVDPVAVTLEPWPPERGATELLARFAALQERLPPRP